MQFIDRFLNYLRLHLSASPQHNRQYRLLYYVSWELISAALIFIGIYIWSGLWLLGFVLIVGVLLALLNLWMLARTQNTVLCSNFFTLLTFFVIIGTNYLIWGIGILHSQWFYLIPLLAASLLGINGLILYSMISMILLTLFSNLAIPPYYPFSASLFLFMEIVNHIFTYLIVITTLASFIYENQRYEQELSDKNYLLQVEKDKYHYLAQFDHLTNLPNRRYFTQYLHELIETKSNQCITVFFTDLDNFKQINDQHGHNRGDEVLLEVSRKLRCCFRENDFIARLGGDEFTAIVTHAPNKQVPLVIAQRIAHEFTDAFIFEENKEYYYTISIGFATYPDDAQTAFDLIAKADEAMYAAKKIKGNSYCSAADYA